MQILQSHITSATQLESVKSVCTTKFQSSFTLSCSPLFHSVPFSVFCSIISHFDFSQPYICRFLAPILNKQFSYFPRGLLAFLQRLCRAHLFLTMALKKQCDTSLCSTENSSIRCHKYDSPHLVICPYFTLPKRPSVLRRHNHSAV